MSTPIGAGAGGDAHECSYELYVMTRAVANLAVTSKAPERLARVRDRINRHRGKARVFAALAVEDALAELPDRPMTEFCSECDGVCAYR